MAQGWRVRALCRRQPVALQAEATGLESVIGDLANTAALDQLCAGADVVIHAAGLVKARRTSEFTTVNVEGSRRLAHAAAGAAHVVFVSSLTAREPQLSPYAASKRAAEVALAELLGGRLSILRPGAIYGPRDRELLPIFQAASASPVLPLLNSNARISMVHVEDAAAQVAAVAAGEPVANPFAICDSRPQGYSWRELMTCAAAAVGRPAAFVPIPDYLVQVIGSLNELSQLLGATPMLTRAKARELLHSDWSMTPSERAFEPPPPRHTLDTGFRDTVQWYRNAGWMKQ